MEKESTMKKESHIDFYTVAGMLEGLIIDSKTFGSEVIVHNGGVYTLEKLIVEPTDFQLNILADEAFWQEFGIAPTAKNLKAIYETIAARKKNSVATKILKEP